MPNIGIDLGTTNSLVAVVLGDTPRCLLDDDDRAQVPSAVRYGPDGIPKAVGFPALGEAGVPDGITFTSFKRFMGRGADDVREEAARFRYPMVEDPQGMVRFKVGPRQVTPVELSSFVLRLLHSRAEECLFSRPSGAVITVPAYFDDAQRQATRDAATVAGIEVLRLLNEPTAAALAYGLDKAQTGQRVAVYDLGGGTFDISILELDDGVFQVLSTAGDTHLGGDDFDQALARLLLDQAGITDADGPTFRAAVRAAEAAKVALTTAESTTIQVTLQGKAIEAELDRATFERLILHLVEQTGAACRLALSDAELTPADIDEVVLVGGSTRVPLVRRFVAELFGRPPHCELDADQVVAIGAAIQADILSGRSNIADDMLLVDVVPLSLGIEMMGGTTERLIPRTSSIPATASQTFTTHVDDQTHVELHIVQGERELAAHNRSLGRFKLRIPEMPAGIPRVRVDFMVDADGLMRVSATEEHTNTKAEIEVRPTYGLPDEEIEQMLEDAIDHAEEDIEDRLLIDARIEGEQILHSLRKALESDGALLEADEGDRFVAAMHRLEAALRGSDRKAILDVGEEVDRMTAPFAQRRIERDLARAIHGRMTDDVAGKLGMGEGA
jgi:molecular chaperone HscA